MKECLSLADLDDVLPNSVQMKPEPVDDDPFLREGARLVFISKRLER